MPPKKRGRGKSKTKRGVSKRRSETARSRRQVPVRDLMTKRNQKRQAATVLRGPLYVVHRISTAITGFYRQVGQPVNFIAALTYLLIDGLIFLLFAGCTLAAQVAQAAIIALFDRLDRNAGQGGAPGGGMLMLTGLNEHIDEDREEGFMGKLKALYQKIQERMHRGQAGEHPSTFDEPEAGPSSGTRSGTRASTARESEQEVLFSAAKNDPEESTDDGNKDSAFRKASCKISEFFEKVDNTMQEFKEEDRKAEEEELKKKASEEKQDKQEKRADSTRGSIMYP